MSIITSTGSTGFQQGSRIWDAPNSGSELKVDVVIDLVSISPFSTYLEDRLLSSCLETVREQL